MIRHTRPVLEQLIARAETFVVAGEERLTAQRARIAGLKRAGGRADQSKKLLKIMEEMQVLQIDHLTTLKRELETAALPRGLR
ncbi:MAG TPA: hypothetical protein VKP67_19895 [Xanthobacteraceae bacterium]|nr:hypothetical protein [Xanthobacteraceae bacterium]